MSSWGDAQNRQNEIHPSLSKYKDLKIELVGNELIDVVAFYSNILLLN